MAKYVEVIPPCKCEEPIACVIAHTVVGKLRRKRNRREFYVYKLLLYFDCIVHGAQEGQITVADDADYGNINDWHVFAPMHARATGRNQFMQNSKIKKKEEKETPESENL